MSRRGRLLRAALPRDHHVRLQERPAQVDPLDQQLVERPLQRARGDVVAALDRVVGVHEHLGLDDRDDAGLLAERGVAGERMRVRADARDRRDAVSDRDDRAPLREARAEAAVLLEPCAQAVEPLRDLLAREAREVVSARVDLDARDDALRGQQLGKRRAVVGGLTDRLVVEDHPADRVLHLRRGEEELAVEPPVLLGRLDADRVEALLDRARGLVGGEDAPMVGDDRPRGVVQLVRSHV